MPKVDGLDKTIRVAMLKDELGDGSEPTEIVTPVTAAAVPAPVTVAMPFDMQAFAAVLAQAMAAAGVASAGAIGDAAKSARTPMPETFLSGGYPEISAFGHPEGDLARPRTELRCPMFLGYYNEDGDVTPAFVIHDDTSTENERVLLNALAPGEMWIESNSGEKAICKVVEKRDSLGAITRLVIAVPQPWLSKEKQAAMPALVNKHGAGLLQQLTQSAA